MSGQRQVKTSELGWGVRKLLSLLLGLLLLGGVLYGILLAAVVMGNHGEVQGEPKVLIILGCQVKPWGPSILLQDRLDTALEFLKEHPDVTVVVSGGQGADEHISEAECMRIYLVEKGVPEEQILSESYSVNTWENLRFSAQTLAEAGLDPEDDVAIVSNEFHMARIRLLWGRITGDPGHLTTLAAPSSHLPSRIKMYIREPIGLMKSLLFDR